LLGIGLYTQNIEETIKIDISILAVNLNSIEDIKKKLEISDEKYLVSSFLT